MGQAIAKAVRLQIVKELESGKSRQQIAADLKVGYSSVRRFCTAYKAGGEAALDNAYANCGPKDIKFDLLIYRSCCWLKHLHRDWGVAYILIKIQQRYGATYDLPKERTVQLWFKQKGYSKKN